MELVYKISDGIEVLPEGFSYGKRYKVYESYKLNEFFRYKIYNNEGHLFSFVDIPKNSLYIWRYFMTKKEERKLKLDEIRRQSNM